ncbi:hypothetical protein CB0940_00980 [Cercospora beticola]|uniref:Fibroin-3 n=2 Tax=Cercospora beticola TaxID=122368 RepID=A0A2G5I9K7_CERBT|nr:hypothetical protein CB0940_00980 [Cercospora beticola]PIB01507.1 hypothetical protein CB0940_00980 [Cercospora beticola]
MDVQARDIADSVASVKNTLSSWDGCMSKAYCKWPVIIGIVVGGLIVLSIVLCIARCLCCGVECCCACCSCFNRCCPSPRGRGERGYEQAPPTPYQNQYQPHPPMHNPYFASGGAGYRGNPSFAQTATFESSSQKVHEDSLPEMPSWKNASSRRIEHHDDDVELEKMEKPEPRVVTSPVKTQAQTERLLNQNPRYNTGQESLSTSTLAGYRGQEVGSTASLGYEGGIQGQSHPHDFVSTGAMGAMSASHANMHAQPYHDYDQQRQQTTSPYSSQRGAAGYYPDARAHEDSPYGTQNSYNNVSEPFQASGYDRNPTAPAAYQSPLHTERQASPVSYPPQANNYYSPAQAQAPGYSQSYTSPTNEYHSGTQAQTASYAQPKLYETNTAPPSYRSEVASPTSPPDALTPGGGIGRKPVHGNWREV